MAKPLPTPDVLGDVLTYTPAKRSLIKISDIRLDGGTQMRAGLDEATVKEYAADFLTHHAWGDFPPVVLFFDGTEYWAGDGFHRIEAYKRAVAGSNPHEVVHADVRAGTRRDAILFAAQANANHGLRRSQADKRRSVETLLRDEEWQQWSDREIARRCNVSADLVGTVRKELAPPFTVVSDSEPATRTFVTKHGTPATMQVGNIGKAQPSYASVWVIERTVSSVVDRNVPRADATKAHADELHQAARTPGCALMREIETALDESDIEFRRSDLVQAMHNVASKIEQDYRRKVAPPIDVPIKAPSSNNVPYANSTPSTEAEEAPIDVKPLMSVFLTDEEQEARNLAADIAAREAAADEVLRSSIVTDFAGTDIPVSFRADYDSDEWYTPEEITRTAHHVMGSIDLDPATCELAQTAVQAGNYFTKVDDGLAQDWNGSVWLNPPYSAPQVWIDKLFAEMASGRVSQAIVLVNNATETAWFQRLLTESKLVCFPARRLAFWRHDHSNVAGRQGQALFYFGNRAEQFYSAYSATGAVLRRLAK